MRIVHDAAPLTAPVEKALELRLHADGSASFASDIQGATVTAANNSERSVTISEVLPDGSTGEEIVFSVVVPDTAANDPAESPAEA